MRIVPAYEDPGTHHGGQFACEECGCKIFTARTVMRLKDYETIGVRLKCASCMHINRDYIFFFKED